MAENLENIGYAIPSAVAVGVAQNIIDHCDGTELECVRKAVLGVMVKAVKSLSEARRIILRSKSPIR